MCFPQKMLGLWYPPKARHSLSVTWPLKITFLNIFTLLWYCSQIFIHTGSFSNIVHRRTPYHFAPLKLSFILKPHNNQSVTPFMESLTESFQPEEVEICRKLCLLMKLVEKFQQILTQRVEKSDLLDRLTLSDR